jgi:hypothetical protein
MTQRRHRDNRAIEQSGNRAIKHMAMSGRRNQGEPLIAFARLSVGDNVLLPIARLPG